MSTADSTTTTTTTFTHRVQAVMAAFEASGLIDRFAANDVLLDLLDAASSDDESARVMSALAELPKSNLVERETLAALLAGLCASQN
jgi:predicted RNA-binding Zn ribbon-like protein